MMAEQSEYVTLISSDGYSFVVQRSSACISGAIKRMLDPSCASIIQQDKVKLLLQRTRRIIDMS